MPKTLLSGSIKYPCQHLPGIANFGKATSPPLLRINSEVVSKSSTMIEQVNALVPYPDGGVFAGRFNNPPVYSICFDAVIFYGHILFFYKVPSEDVFIKFQ
jgi:hypothetical protein